MESNKKDLKLQAFLEKIGTLTANYENTIADLRVEMTLLSAKNESLQQQLDELTTEKNVQAEEAKPTK